MKSAVCTIVAKNYLAHARVLMESVRLWNPEYLRIVILVDRIDGYFDPGKESFDVILSEDLGIPNSRWFHFKYPVLELSTAVKPYALSMLLQRYELDKILYLDPDIRLYASLQPLLDALDRYSIVLTPHLIDSLDDGLEPSDLDILKCGAYNLGFIGLCSGPETCRFLEWWRKKLYDLCLIDLTQGLFVDQRWVDLAPGLFSQVGIIREPGYNVAYWNLNSRQVDRIEDGSLRVNGQPLYFFHFSGFDPRSPEQFSQHQNRFRLSTLGPEVQALALQYRDDLFLAGYEDCRRWPYAYGRFANGFPIPEMGRSLLYESEEALNRLEDPFSEEGFRAFVDTCNQPIAEDGDGTGISRLAYRIYRTRTDMQAAMPDVLGHHSLGFLEWFVSSGRSDHGLNPVFLTPIWDAIEAGKKRKKHGNRTHSVDPVWIKARKEKSEKLNELIPGKGGLKMTRLAQIIYESRPELQRSFPDPCGRDSVRFLTWILTYGKKEHLLTEPYLAPLRSQWDGVLASLDSASARLWHRFLRLGMSTAVSVRSVAAPVSYRIERMKAKMGVRPQTTALQFRPARILQSSSDSTTPGIAGEAVGINLVGYVRAETGVGESARAAWRSAKAAGIPVALKDIRYKGEFRSEDHSAGPTTDRLPYPISVFHVNADQSQTVLKSLGQASASGKYNIGFWHWELERFPERWTSAFDDYQEIWTSSTFCQQSIATESPVPVIQIPHSISFNPPAGMGRDYFGLPSGRFLFLTLFDLMSVFDRKNPLGSVEAFKRAFGNDPSVQLIIKINNAEKRPDHLKTLREGIAGYPITIVDRTFTRDETYALMNVCQCLISLHRSEGFGLTLAEAMFLGKPVIATAYSGNMDFTRFDNSFLVGYRLKPIGKNNEPYNEDNVWADPSIEQAAQQMRTIIANPQICRTVAATGQEFVRTRLSPEAVGRQIADRLKRIQNLLGRRDS